ncbi:hypothetical protein AVEN_130382-1 [Araneus ventricosus]|uniref:Uncharacterized protein n=1 Tax=Araneus ventricosus TaxID=182803 RepID=A0A4Y2BD94_ARAVE|nr:hypothetical protein AVEN_130382-1 [Araneus ventricosus]
METRKRAAQSETADSNVIVNTLIQCFREASKGAEESIIKSSSIRLDVTATAHSSRDADIENNVSDTKPSKKENSPSAEEYEKQLDRALEQFVKDTYQLAVAALEKKKSSGGSLEGNSR